MSSSSATPPGTPAALQETGEMETPLTAHSAMRMVLTNQFRAFQAIFQHEKQGEEAEESKELEDVKLGMVHTYFSFLQAMSSFGTEDLERALEIAWKSERQGRELLKQNSGGSVLQFLFRSAAEDPEVRLRRARAKIEGQLVQADCHLLASVVQLIKQQFVKGGWNIHKSWKHYTQAKQSIAGLREQFPDTPFPDIEGWADFGVGLFHLLISLLPQGVLKVARWIGFGSNRELGLELLRKSQAGTSFVAPLSAILLLSWDLAISTFTGESDDTLIEEATRLLEWADIHFPGGLFFRFFRARLHRSQLRLREAIEESERGLQDCTEMPSLAIIFLYLQGWCAFFLQDWLESASYFMPLLPTELQRPVKLPSRPFALNPEVVQGEAGDVEGTDEKEEDMTADGEADEQVVSAAVEEDESREIQPTKASAQALYAFQIGLCFSMAGDFQQTRYYFSKVRGLCGRKPRPLESWAAVRAAEWLAKYQNIEASETTGEMTTEASIENILNSYEMIFLWNGYSQMPRANVLAIAAHLRGMFLTPPTLSVAAPCGSTVSPTAVEPSEIETASSSDAVPSAVPQDGADLCTGVLPETWGTLRQAKFHMLYAACKLELQELRLAEAHLRIALQLVESIQTSKEQAVERRDGFGAFSSFLMAHCLLSQAQALELGSKFNERHRELLLEATKHCERAAAAEHLLLFKSLQVRMHACLLRISKAEEERKKRIQERLEALEQEIQDMEAEQIREEGEGSGEQRQGEESPG